MQAEINGLYWCSYKVIIIIWKRVIYEVLDYLYHHEFFYAFYYLCGCLCCWWGWRRIIFVSVAVVEVVSGEIFLEDNGSISCVTYISFIFLCVIMWSRYFLFTAEFLAF